MSPCPADMRPGVESRYYARVPTSAASHHDMGLPTSSTLLLPSFAAPREMRCSRQGAWRQAT